MVRLKHRYLLVNILYPNDSSKPHNKNDDSFTYTVHFHQPTSDRIDGRVLTQAIRRSVSELFGDYGAGMTGASLQVKYFSPATSTAIIRVSRAHYRLVWAALTFTHELPKPVLQPCVMQVVRVSGTMKKAEEEAIRRARVSIRKAQGRVGGRQSLAASADAGATVLGAVDDEFEFDESFANGIEDGDRSDDEEESG